MDHDDEIVGKIFTRREALSIAGRAGLMLASGASLIPALGSGRSQTSGQKVHLIAAPSMTEGPFFVDEKLNRSDIRGGSTRHTITEALPMLLNLTIYSGNSPEKFVPLANAQVDVWHVDASGTYSDEPQGLNPEDTKGANWLRGYQVTDSNGQVRFTTVFPGWYEGRTTHIHFKVRYHPEANKHATFTSQLFVQDEFADKIYANSPYRERPSNAIRNRSDQVFSDPLPDGSPVGKSMTITPTRAKSGSGIEAHFAVALLRQPEPKGGLFDYGG
jgi:protocatechuate 3,4-dioxygenase beta subunit